MRNCLQRQQEAIQNSKISQYLKSPYVNFDGLKERNALQRKYKEFKNSSE